MPLGHDCEGREEPTVAHTALYRAMLARSLTSFRRHSRLAQRAGSPCVKPAASLVPKSRSQRRSQTTGSASRCMPSSCAHAQSRTCPPVAAVTAAAAAAAAEPAGLAIGPCEEAAPARLAVEIRTALVAATVTFYHRSMCGTATPARGRWRMPTLLLRVGSVGWCVPLDAANCRTEFRVGPAHHKDQPCTRPRSRAAACSGVFRASRLPVRWWV
jgi:hypothetical protein